MSKSIPLKYKSITAAAIAEARKILKQEKKLENLQVIRGKDTAVGPYVIFRKEGKTIANLWKNDVKVKTPNAQNWGQSSITVKQVFLYIK